MSERNAKLEWACEVLARNRHQGSDRWESDGFEAYQRGGLIPPAAYNEFEAVAIAEAYERRPLVWSSEPPKVPGWYWIEGTAGSRMIAPIGDNHIYRPDCRFAGPIPEPVEPEGDA